jgi:hypothetical protein
VVKKIAALGIPGLFIIVLMHLAPVAGAAALTWALAVRTGPFHLPAISLLVLRSHMEHDG